MLRPLHGSLHTLCFSFELHPLHSTGLAAALPEDLYCLIKKAVAVRKHLERNRKVCLILCSSMIQSVHICSSYLTVFLGTRHPPSKSLGTFKPGDFPAKEFSKICPQTRCWSSQYKTLLSPGSSWLQIVKPQGEIWETVSRQIPSTLKIMLSQHKVETLWPKFENLSRTEAKIWPITGAFRWGFD